MTHKAIASCGGETPPEVEATDLRQAAYPEVGHLLVSRALVPACLHYRIQCELVFDGACDPTTHKIRAGNTSIYTKSPASTLTKVALAGLIAEILERNPRCLITSKSVTQVVRHAIRMGEMSASDRKYLGKWSSKDVTVDLKILLDDWGEVEKLAEDLIKTAARANSETALCVEGLRPGVVQKLAVQEVLKDN